MAAIRLGAAAAALLATAGCGDSNMDADEFVQRIHDEGVQIELGAELTTSDPSKRIYAIKLKRVAPAASGDQAFTNGSLTVYDDTGGADGGLDQCNAAGLACYQAGNIVVALEGEGIEGRQLAVAVTKLGG